MTISVTEISRAVIGNKRMVTGSYSDTSADGNSGAGGEIPTGLITVEHFSVMKKGSVIDASKNAIVNEIFPTTTGTMTLIYDAPVSGIYLAIGR